jgi:NOL1/NOP2/fmu family ribosome biogenesis protein
MFRRHQETAEEWQSGSPDGCAQRQAEILSCAARMVRPGGRLLYSTCTFGRVENEDQIARFLASHPDFFAVPFALDGLPPAQNGMLRVFPHQMRGEGHFAALLERGGGDAERCPIFLPPEPDRKERALCEAFLKDEILTPCAPNVSFMGRLVCAPARLPAVDGVKVLRLGLHLGQVKGQTFVPDHALAMALPARRTAPLDAKQALSWLHGETIPVPETFKGWCAPTFEGLQLGWGKASDGCLKNHYPKGLRK